MQDDPGDLFYIIKEGEAAVYQDTHRGTRLVNKLFRSDFFGEQALLRREPRMASVQAVSQRLVCLALRRDVFVSLLGDLGDIMNREKSPQVRFSSTATGSPRTAAAYVLRHAATLHL